MFRTPFSLYRAFSLAEAVTWAGLITALIVRAVSGAALAVTIAGDIHGFVFLGYVVSTVLVAKNLRWHPGVTGLALIAAIVPFVTIPAEIWLHRTRRLEGPGARNPATILEIPAGMTGSCAPCSATPGCSPC